MLQVLVGYVSDLDIPIGWLVVTGDAEFFALTKRLHNQIHGRPVNGARSARAESRPATQMLAAERGVGWPPGSGPAMWSLLHDPRDP